MLLYILRQFHRTFALIAGCAGTSYTEGFEGRMCKATEKSDRSWTTEPPTCSDVSKPNQICIRFCSPGTENFLHLNSSGSVYIWVLLNGNLVVNIKIVNINFFPKFTELPFSWLHSNSNAKAKGIWGILGRQSFKNGRKLKQYHLCLCLKSFTFLKWIVLTGYRTTKAGKKTRRCKG